VECVAAFAARSVQDQTKKGRDQSFRNQSGRAAVYLVAISCDIKRIVEGGIGFYDN
jgi:hypothetical protein